MIVAIDGPAAAGKGTLARRLAEHYDLALLDTGLLYRAVGLKTVNAGKDPEDADAATETALGLDPADMKDGALRSDEAAAAASKVAAIPGVRQALLDFQRSFAKTPPGGKRGAILDGRDIGTVVCPDADVKIFVTASVEVRAERRLKELRERGIDAIHSQVLRDMRDRDARDSQRSVAPLTAASDALELITDELDANAAFAKAIEFIEKRNAT